MIKSLTITKFRQFENKSIQLGKYITCIAGKNATGKSSLLAMIGNSCELKTTKELKPLVKKSFRSEFSDIFKGSEKFDPTGSNLFRINFTNISPDYRDFRITWQKDRTKPSEKRFRVIPYYKDENGKMHSKKADIPVIYLTLSRLIPYGEVLDAKLINMNLTEDENKWFKEKYAKIFTPFYNITGLDSYYTQAKISVGINTDFYDSKNNSAGQDNLGQILLSLISFKRLSEKITDYNGGLFLIDELDASLHPYAQTKLVELLIECCKNFKLQVIVTTHSPTILKELSSKIQYNKSEDVNNNIEIIYLTNANKKLEIKRNPSFQYIESDLFITDAIRMNQKITCYSEDDETRWFAKQLYPEFIGRINFVNIKMGCGNLLQLDKHDRGYFANILFIFDGDFEEELQNDSYNIKDHFLDNRKNKYILPGPSSPEKLLYDFLVKLDGDHEIWNQLGFKYITKESLEHTGPYSDFYKEVKDTRVKFKKWFNLYQSVFEEIGIVDTWKKENAIIYEEHKSQFIESYNYIANKMLLPTINTVT